ncbi:MAG TPA: putative selenate ABC transporter substrate-binding protein [Blastocatellia bacterium]|nr:putative selenate ABC transporter substrate-binding protein [Blastocatellia bacterium]
MTTRFRFSLTILLLGAFALSAACKNGSAPAVTLRLSMIPTNDPGKMLRDSKLLVDYLEKETGANVEMTIPTNYAAVVEAVANDQVDIAYFGGFTYVQASKRSGVLPLVQRERDQNFHSLFITRPDTGITNLDELKGHTFAFGDVNSTSGHLMPEYFMRQAKVDLEVIAKALYSGGHDATALAVANKKVDAGALDETIFQRMVSDGKLDSNQVNVFYTTPPYMDYVWAARKGLDPKLADAFAAAFLKLDGADPAHKAILDFLNATRYVRAEDASYDRLRQAATEAGLLK